jgi:hypothetical protein
VEIGFAYGFAYALGYVLTPEITVWFRIGRLTMSIANAPLNGASGAQQVGMRRVVRNCASVGLLLRNPNHLVKDELL